MIAKGLVGRRACRDGRPDAARPGRQGRGQAIRGGPLVNFSDVFIRRPVATTLIMLAILLFGVVAYRSLPISDLPNVDFPTIRVDAGLPGASPETMAASVATPLERQFSTIAGLDSMTSSSALGSTSITLQFNLSRDLDAAAQDVQAAIAAAGRAAAAEHADAADVPEGQPRGLADPLSLAGVDDAAAIDAGRVRADDDGAAHLDGPRRRPGAGVRVAEVRGADPARPEGARRPRHRDRRGRPGRAQRQRQPADRDALRQAPVLHRGSRRPAHPRRGLRTADRDLPQRRARAHPGHRPLHRQRRERQDRRLERHGEGLRAHDHARHPETARHEHGRDRRQRSARFSRPSRSSCPPPRRCACASTARSRSASPSTTSGSRCF